MNRMEFEALFISSLDRAKLIAEKKFKVVLPSCYLIELHGAGHSGNLISVTEAASAMYIDDKTFYRIIDVGLKSADAESSTFFVRTSQHKPVEFSKTWNQPNGSGPFKVIEPSKLY